MSEDAEETPEKPRLKDARTNPWQENPWYVLMTVAGEQPDQRPFWDYDEDLHARNRRYFNGWMAQHLSDEDKQKLIEEERATAEDLAPLTPEEQTEIDRQIAERCGPDVRLTADDRAVNLSDAEVAARLICIGFVFSGPADFRSGTFSGTAYFQNATFSGNAYFWNATFSGTADFRSATFSGTAYFRNATFSGTADFRNATFSGTAYFRNASFSRYAYFENTTFARTADFQNATFSGTAYFENATFFGTADFQNAEVNGTPDFSDTTFKARTLLTGMSFRQRDKQENENEAPRSRPPMFFNATLHEDTDFTDIEWPPIATKRRSAITDRKAYERLKLLMASQNKFADEHMFQRMELGCREIEEGWWSLSAWGSRLFRYTSDYGWSLGRPIWWLAVLICSGAVLIWNEELTDPNTQAPPVELDNALGMSFANVFSFLPVRRLFHAEHYKHLTLMSEVVTTTQMILGPFLLFLFGLALRNRFRIK